MRQFFAAEGTNTPDPLYGPATLMAKLAGTIVAHASAEAVGTDLHIRAFYVSSALRGKRIGRGLLLRLLELAARMQCLRIVAPAESSCERFFKRNGFVDAEGVLTRVAAPFTVGRDTPIIRDVPPQ